VTTCVIAYHINNYNPVTVQVLTFKYFFLSQLPSCDYHFLKVAGGKE